MKICSLLPSGTEILFALGLGDQVIGVSDLCDFPLEARNKPIVCRSKIDPSVLASDQVEELMHQLLANGESPYELDQEWLSKHVPDVVLTQDLCYFCEVNAEHVEHALRGIPAEPKVIVLRPKTLAEIFDTIREVGAGCGAAEEGAKLADEMGSLVSSIGRRLEGVNHRPKALSLEGINPIVIGGHWIPDLLIKAGCSQEQYLPGCPAARLSWDEVRAQAPEKLYIDLCSSDLDRSQREIPWLAMQEGWSDLPAVRTGEVYLLDHVYFSSPGPRIVQGLEILAQLTHPDVFTGIIPPDTVCKLDATSAASCPPDQIAGCFFPFPPAA